MIKLNIPKDWSEVFIDQFKELDSIDLEMYDTIHSLQLERLAILSDTSSDDEVWDDMDVRFLNKIITDLKFLSTKPSTFVNKTILDGELSLIDFNNITFGEFIDLEYYITKGENKNIDLIASILYKKTKIGEWGEIIFEPYSVVNLTDRAKIIEENCKLTDIYGAINAFKDWREAFLDTYKSMFQPNIEDDYDEVEMNEEELEELRQIEEEERKMAEYGWQRMLITLSDSDLVKMESYLSLGIIFIFNMLSVKNFLKI